MCIYINTEIMQVEAGSADCFGVFGPRTLTVEICCAVEDLLAEVALWSHGGPAASFMADGAADHLSQGQNSLSGDYIRIL